MPWGNHALPRRVVSLGWQSRCPALVGANLTEARPRQRRLAQEFGCQGFSRGPAPIPRGSLLPAGPASLRSAVPPPYVSPREARCHWSVQQSLSFQIKKSAWNWAFEGLPSCSEPPPEGAFPAHTGGQSTAQSPGRCQGTRQAAEEREAAARSALRGRGASGPLFPSQFRCIDCVARWDSAVTGPPQHPLVWTQTREAPNPEGPGGDTRALPA